MGLSFKLEAFEGPLDLLLQLIEKNKVDIYDIPIAMIADQYMEYVAGLESEDMDVVSEFLVMAATLLDIKSRMLLPQEEDEEGVREDPREELVQRLLEYKMCKAMSQELREKEKEAEKYFYKAPTVPSEVAKYEPPIDTEQLLKGMTIDRLETIFRSVMKRRTDRIDPVRSTFGTIPKEPFRVSEKIHLILGYTSQNKKFSFRNLLEEQSSRTEIVVTFLAVLELMKMGYLQATQAEAYGEIDLERTKEGSVSAEELEKALELEF